MAITLADVRKTSPLRQYNYEFIIPTWPGGGNGDMLRIPVLTASLGGFSIEPIETSIAGIVEKFAGRGMYPRTLNIEWRETNALDVWSALYEWRELMFNSETGVQAVDNGDAGYRTTALLKLYNEGKDEIASVKYEGVFPEDVADSPLSGETSDIVRVSATFSYDRLIKE